MSISLNLCFVFQAMHRETNLSAALKQVTLEADEDLETFMIEIDILSEFKHENIVRLIEAYHFDGKLWVSLVITCIDIFPLQCIEKKKKNLLLRGQPVPLI